MNRLRAIFPTFIYLYHLWSRRLTGGGKLLTLALLFCTCSFFYSTQMMGELVASILGLLIVVAIASRLFRPRLAARVMHGAALRVGTPAELLLEVRNQSRFPASDVDLEALPRLREWKAGESTVRIDRLEGLALAEATLAVIPEQRGELTPPSIQVTSTYPFHLVKTFASQPVDGMVLVYPASARLDGSLLAEVAARRQSDEAAGNFLVGDSDDYLGNRDYVPGSPARRFDYRSWARLGRPIVREYHQPQPLSITLVVDTFLSSEAGERRQVTLPADELATMEQALSIAAAVIDDTLETSLAIDRLVIGTTVVQSPVDGERLPADLMLESLAHAAAEATPVKHQGLERATSGSRLLVVVMTRWDETRQAWLEKWESDGYDVLGMVIQRSAAKSSRPSTRATAALLEVPLPPSLVAIECDDQQVWKVANMPQNLPISSEFTTSPATRGSEVRR